MGRTPVGEDTEPETTHLQAVGAPYEGDGVPIE
jgi:hypothetical protein